MTTRMRRRYEGSLSVDPRIARLLRVHLRLPRAIVEDIVRAQCYVVVWRYSDGARDEIPIVRGKWHGIVRWWRADGTRDCEIPYVDGKAHGKATWWLADGTIEKTQLWQHEVLSGTVEWGGGMEE